MTLDDLNEIRDLLNDEPDKWRLDAGDWMAYVEELVDEIDRPMEELRKKRCCGCCKATENT